MTLYHNALSMCSGKVRVCLAEKSVPYESRHIELVETQWYQNVSPEFLQVNPGGTVPVLLHHGHPIYESHEQIAYIDAHLGAPSAPGLVPDAATHPVEAAECQRWVHLSSMTDFSPAGPAKTLGNCIPPITFPLFVQMLKKVDTEQIQYGLDHHPIKDRPRTFMAFKLGGIEVFRDGPFHDAVRGARDAMRVHLETLSEQLQASGGPFLLGSDLCLGDVGLMSIMERLRVTDNEFLWAGLEAVEKYWAALQQRRSYQDALVAHSHPNVVFGEAEIKAAKAEHEWYRKVFEE